MANLIQFFKRLFKYAEESERPFLKYDQDVIMPWSQVFACYENKLNSEAFRDYKANSWVEYAKYKSCPKCGLRSHQLTWIKFSSPSGHWKNRAGCSGSLSICENCKRQVQFILRVMN